MQALDERDRALIATRLAAMGTPPEPQVGEFVEFADGTVRRVAYVWRDEHDVAFGVQTGLGDGSFYLGNGYLSFSGSLASSVPPGTLTVTDRRRPGSLWLFHHDQRVKFNGVEGTGEFRVFTCTLAAPR